MKERFAKRLWGIAREKAIDGGFLFSSEAEEELAVVIHRAADRMEVEGKLDDAGCQFEAKANMMKLIDYMVEEARNTEEGLETLELGRDVFERARNVLSPLWPYY